MEVCLDVVDVDNPLKEFLGFRRCCCCWLFSIAVIDGVVEVVPLVVNR